MTRAELLAELEILERFDAMRERAGHDYGAGQRGAELMRRRHRLEVDPPLYGESRRGVTMPELAEAFERVGRPRLARIEREDYRRHTPATSRTLRTWHELERRLFLASVPA